MTTPNTFLLSLLMFATGVAIPLMAAWNSRLGTELESPWAAAFILFVLGAVICGIAMLFLGLPKQGWFSATPLYYAGGTGRLLLYPVDHLDGAAHWRRQCRVLRVVRADPVCRVDRSVRPIRCAEVCAYHATRHRYRLYADRDLSRPAHRLITTLYALACALAPRWARPRRSGSISGVFIAGIGIGVELVIGTYLSEPAPKQIRGRAFAWPHTRDLALETISN